MHGTHSHGTSAREYWRYIADDRRMYAFVPLMSDADADDDAACPPEKLTIRRSSVIRGAMKML